MATSTVDELKRVPLFSGLDRRELDLLAHQVKERRFPAGSVIMKEGSTGQGLFIIRDGAVSVRRGDRALARLGPGEFFGELAVLDEGPRTADVVADTDTVCLALVSWEIRPLLQEHAGMTYKMLQEVVRRLRSGGPKPAD
jgi:CRP-like cAMP-binding protein